MTSSALRGKGIRRIDARMTAGSTHTIFTTMTYVKHIGFFHANFYLRRGNGFNAARNPAVGFLFD
jgi:hypothetical protein